MYFCVLVHPRKRIVNPGLLHRKFSGSKFARYMLHRGMCHTIGVCVTQHVLGQAWGLASATNSTLHYLDNDEQANKLRLIHFS